MGFNTFPCNPYPISTDELNKGNNDDLNIRVAALESDVSDLDKQKANQITIALPFNPETTYEVGDLVYYNGLSYRCTTEHTGEWDADDFAATTIANELGELMSGLIGIGTELNNTSYSGIKYISIGRLKIVFISTQVLSDGDELGLPAGINNSVVLLRDEVVGGCVQVVIDTSQTISVAGGAVNFVSGHTYSGYYTYISTT